VLRRIRKRLVKALLRKTNKPAYSAYHHAHRRRAEKILDHIEAARGKINQAFKSKSKSYAIDVLGWEGYAPWLCVYSAIAGTFKEGWIPDNYYGKVVVPALKGRYGSISGLKPLSGLIFRSDVFPDIAYYVNGLLYTKSFETLNRYELKDLLFEESEKIVFKVDESHQGKGVFILDRSSFDDKTEQGLSNGVFQRYIDQHYLFEEFMPSSVATLRITTVVNDDGVCSVRACYLRLGRANDTHIKSDSHIRIPIDPISGDFAEEGYLTTWTTIDRHPDSKMKFAGNKIPAFLGCVSTVLELHRMVPFVRCIGWDVSVDKSNDVRVMEWNGVHNGIKFTEATQGPCFADLKWEKLWR
jgi:hypothetical protein